jgi:hypothetical protein
VTQIGRAVPMTSRAEEQPPLDYLRDSRKSAIEPLQRKDFDDQKLEEIAPSGTPEAPPHPPRQLVAMKLRPIVINMPSRRRDG